MKRDVVCLLFFFVKFLLFHILIAFDGQIENLPILQIGFEAGRLVLLYCGTDCLRVNPEAKSGG